MSAPKLAAQIQGQGSVSADNMNTWVQSCDNVAQLRAFVGLPGIEVLIRGIGTPNDGGAGSFFWDATGIGPDDGVNIIVPTGAATGCWVRLVTFVAGAIEPYAFSTTAILLSTFGPTIVLPNGTIAITAGRTSIGDGGGGEFYYDANDTTTADNGGTIRVDAQNRRWYAITNNQISPLLFGALGNDSNDDTTAIQSAITYAETIGNPVYLGGLTYKITSGLTLNIAKSALIGSGAVLDASSFTTQIALDLTCSGTDPNFLSLTNAAHPITGVIIKGPNGTSGGNTSIGIATNPPTISGSPWLQNITFRDGGVAGFNIGLECGAGVFDIIFDNFNFGSIVGAQMFDGIVFTSGANSGERCVIRGTQIFNYYGSALIVNMAGDFYLDHCSIDGNNRMITVNAESVVYATGCHFENLATDNDYLFYTNSANAAIVLYGGRIALDVSRTHEIGYSAIPGSSGNLSGINLFGTQIELPSSPSTYAPNFLIGGTGPAMSQGALFLSDIAKVPLAYSANFLRDGTFSNSNALLDWTAVGTWASTGAVGPAIPFTSGLSNTTTSVTTTASAATNTLTSGKFSCKPCATPALKFVAQTSGLAAAGATFTWAITFLDANGNQISSQATNTTTDLATFTGETILVGQPAPQGTVSCTIVFTLASSGGASTLWVSNVAFSIYN